MSKRVIANALFKSIEACLYTKPCSKLSVKHALTSLTYISLYLDDAFKVGERYASEGEIKGLSNVIQEASIASKRESPDPLILIAIPIYVATYGFMRKRGLKSLAGFANALNNIMTALRPSEVIAIIHALEVLEAKDLLEELEANNLTKRKIEYEFFTLNDFVREVRSLNWKLLDPHFLVRTINLVKEYIETYKIDNPLCAWHYILHKNIIKELADDVWDAFRKLVAYDCNAKKALHEMTQLNTKCVERALDYTWLARTFIGSIFIYNLLLE